MFDLREAKWFGEERAQGYSRVMAVAFAPTFIWFYFQAMGPTGSDFLAFWSAANHTLSGDAAAAYKWFLNPPPFLLVLLPFGLLPYPVAWVAWIALTYAIWLLVARRLIHGATWPIAVFPGAIIAAWHGQNGLLTAALFIGAILSSRSSRPVLTGALLGALIIKPHLALLAPVALIAGREWKAFGAAFASAVALLLLSWLVFGSTAFAAFFENATYGSYIFRPTHDGSTTDFYLRMPTVFAGLRPIIGAVLALAVQALAALAMAAIVWRVWSRSDDWLGKGSVLIIATCLSTPYLFHYDLAALILPICWLVKEGLKSGFYPWEKTLIAGFYWSPLLGRALAPALQFNIMPIVLIALLWIVLRRLTNGLYREPPASVEASGTEKASDAFT